MSASVRVTGRPNTNFLVGYPGISATLPRIEGTVEIRPPIDFTGPVHVSLITVSLHRRETIHPSADSITKKHLAAPRKETRDIVGKEMLLFRCPNGREFEEIMSMDLPFVIFIPFGRGEQEASRRVPPASMQLPKRTVETSYEIVVLVQHGAMEQNKHPFPVPIVRYDTLSTFGMYNKSEVGEARSDSMATLSISLPRWSYGPNDPVTIYIKLAPNLDWMHRARKVTIQKITYGITEEIIYNHEGDEPQRKVKSLIRRQETVGIKLPESGYFTNLGLVFPAKDVRDGDGILPRNKPEFPNFSLQSFTTTAGLYKVEFYLAIKVHLSGAKDIELKQPIVVCPLDHASCKAEMDAIEQAAKDARHVNTENPMLPLATIIRPGDEMALQCLGFTTVGGMQRPLIE